MMMGLPCSSLTVCFSLFSVMAWSEIFQSAEGDIHAVCSHGGHRAPEPKGWQAQKGLVQKKLSRLMVP